MTTSVTQLHSPQVSDEEWQVRTDLAALHGHLTTVTASLGTSATPMVTVNHDIKDPKVQQGLVLVLRQVISVFRDGLKEGAALVANLIATFPFSISVAGGGSAGVEFIGAILGDIQGGATVFNTSAFLIFLTNTLFGVVALMLDELVRLLETVQGLMQLGVVSF